jgi:alpha-glucoside transport system substrate-binding protein
MLDTIALLLHRWRARARGEDVARRCVAQHHPEGGIGSFRPPRAARAVAAVVSVVLLAACQADASPRAEEVRILGSWSGPELAAFEAVIAPFERRTGVRVTYRTTRDLRGVLDRDLEAAAPPDIAGLDGPGHMRELAARGVLRDLAGVLDAGAYRAAVPPTFIELGSVDGRLVGVFVRTSIKGLIWHDPGVFRAGEPGTWEELLRVAARSATGSTSEWCVGLGSEDASGWPGTDLVEQLLLGTAGVDAYDAWVRGALPWDSSEIRRAFRLYAQLFGEDAVHGGVQGAIETDFRDAGGPLFSDPPGCLLLPQGSFMAAFLQGEGRTAGRDFDFFAWPPIDEPATRAVIGGGDLFGVLDDRPAAAALMRYLVSDEAQRLWVAQGGSLSVKTSVTEYPDPVSRRAAEELTSADAFRFDASDQMPADLSAAFRVAVLRVAEDPGRIDEELAALDRVAAASR